jgi:prepilin-type N-terminal cleavage/methylation domain-containing protein
MKRNPEQGVTLLETMVALTVLAIGIVAVARVFPSITGSQLEDQDAHDRTYYSRARRWKSCWRSRGRTRL